MSPETLRELDYLITDGCWVSINYGSSAPRWSCILGHYMTPRWPQVHAYGDTLEEAVKAAMKLAMEAHDPNAAESAALVISA